MEIEAAGITKEIQNDEEFMKRYSEIGEMYYSKRALIRELKGGKDSALVGKFAELNIKIKESEGAFISDVARETASGKKFSFEVLAEKFNLEVYEKKVLLFFLFLEFFHVTDNLCPEMELLELMDLQDSPCGRMRDFKYLRKSASLFKKGLLNGDSVSTGKSATFNVALNNLALETFSGLISGEEICEGETKAEETQDPAKACDSVGMLKDPEYKLDDVVLEENLKDKVMFFLSALKEPGMEALEIDKTIKKSKGINFLFYGPPGTGKSMLTEGVASYLGKKLLIVETPKIFGRWVGDTDKAITKIFRVAKENNLVICMDEADSLLYNRNYAVQEHEIRFVNIMLQEMERFEGVAIFTTNMDNLLDPAVERRISLRIKFELPDEKMRAEIWKTHIPPTVKAAEDVDFLTLAKRFEFAGGYIRNTVLNALRRVALRKQDTVSMEDLVWSGNMEKQGLFNKEQPKGSVGFTACG